MKTSMVLWVMLVKVQGGVGGVGDGGGARVTTTTTTITHHHVRYYSVYIEILTAFILCLASRI